MNKATERAFQEWLKNYKTSFANHEWALELARKASCIAILRSRNAA